MSQASKKIADGAFWSIAYNICNALYGFIAIPILISHFGKAEYGMIGLAQSVNIYIQLLDLGMNSTSVRYFSVWLAKGDKEKVNQLFTTCLSFYSVIGIINAVVLIVLSLFSTSLFNVSPEQGIVVRDMMIILAFAAFLNWYSSCFDQLIRATENVAWIQKRSFIPKLLQILILVITVFADLPLLLFFALTTFSFFTILPLSVSKIRKETPFIRFLPRFNKQVFKEILPYTLNIFSFSIFKFSFTYLCPIFLGIRASLESVTDYKIINTIASVVTLITGTFLGALLPSTSRIVAQNDKNAYYRIAYEGTKILTIITCFCVFGLISISDNLLTIYVGESYRSLVPWLNILLLVYLGNHILCISSLILSGTDISALNKMVIISSTTGLIAAWILIPILQTGGVVIASLIYEILQTCFYYVYYMPRVLHIKPIRIIKSILPIIAFGVCACYTATVITIFSSIWANIFISGFIFTILFSLLILIYLNKEEKKSIYDLIKSIVSK